MAVVFIIADRDTPHLLPASGQKCRPEPMDIATELDLREQCFAVIARDRTARHPVYEHDFHHLADDVPVSHQAYDKPDNETSITPGTRASSGPSWAIPSPWPGRCRSGRWTPTG